MRNEKTLTQEGAIAGRETDNGETVLMEGMMPEGTRDVRFDGSGLASGTYFVRLESPQLSATQKIHLVR